MHVGDLIKPTKIPENLNWQEKYQFSKIIGIRQRIVALFWIEDFPYVATNLCFMIPANCCTLTH